MSGAASVIMGYVGIETVQVMQYAARAIQLAEQTCGAAIEPSFLEKLERARSNIPRFQHGAQIYEQLAKPAIVDLQMVGAHYAISGSYFPLQGFGEQDSHVCAFRRFTADEEVVMAVPRLVVQLAGGIERAPMGPDVWGDTYLALPHGLPGQEYRNVFTGEVLAVANVEDAPGLMLGSVLRHFPVALYGASREVAGSGPGSGAPLGPLVER